jgi:hypothetical protein
VYPARDFIDNDSSNYLEHSTLLWLGTEPMPVLKNPRRQRFAQLLASSKTAKDAYEIAG